MRGGKREGSGRKLTGESKAIQKSIALPVELWNGLKTTDNAKKILTAFGYLGRKHDISQIDLVLDFMIKAYENNINYQKLPEIQAKSETKPENKTETAIKTKPEKPVKKAKKGKKKGLTDEQQEILNVLLNGEDCFITGGAGVGKSFLVKEFLKRVKGKDVVLCAPTGIAALNVNGRTVHSQFEIKVTNGVYNDLDIQKKKKWAEEYQYDEDKAMNALFFCDVVIIDEVSMLRGDLFEMVIATLEGILANPEKRFTKEIQLILVGDFWQLPPVLTSGESYRTLAMNITDENGNIVSTEMVDPKTMYKSIYGNASGYPFLSKKWNFKKYELTQVIRQENKEHSTALNEIREGRSQPAYDWICKNSSKTPIKKALWACGKNKNVDSRNQTELDKLPGKAESFELRICNKAPELIKDYEIKNQALKDTKEIVTLKPGCEVVSMRNRYINGELAYMNGSHGEVLKIDKDKEIITVKFENGVIDEIERRVCEITRDVITVVNGKKKAETKLLATYSQIPLTLGYALTIHKMQGLTVNALNIDDDCNFLPGQYYVALSRCTNIENTHVKAKSIIPKTSDEVKAFYEQQ